MYKLLLKPFFFSFQPEKAHHLTMSMFRFLLSLPIVNSLYKSSLKVEAKSLEREFFGLKFKNPVGLAAGFDKDGKYFRDIAALGFGFLELGTVTPLPQGGNPQPRLFRVPQDEGLINRMGFNNDGVDALVERLQGKRPEGVIIGGNIGKNKVTPNEEAEKDYEICFEKLFDHVDYFVVNVSSPNTPNLRALQDKEPLTKLLSLLQQRNHEKPAPKPILLKIAPDLTNEQLDDILDIVKDTKIDGVIATNTTISREGLNTSTARIQEIGNGGLSGKPVQQRSTEVIKYLFDKSGKQLKIIGVGGIDSPAAAQAKLDAGACLVQVYSGMVYYGPTLVKDILKKIR